MLKDLVIKQRNNKDELLKREYIVRDKAVKAAKWLDSDLIKVVLGPRRAGKSIFSLSLLKDKSFGYFNFDDEGLPDLDTFNYDELMRELALVYPGTKYLLFDEIQNLPKWEPFVNRLQREGYNLTITGSNSNLLSRELATALTGRHIPIEIMPFNYAEFLRAKNNSGMIEDYLINGGYPEVVVKNLDPKEYLDVLYDSLLFKDIVKRHKVRFGEDLDKLSTYLISNFANLYSSRRLKNILNFKSDKTIGTYVDYLKEAYLLFSLNCFSAKAGERIKSPQKIYAVDSGLIKAKAIQISSDFGKLMENLVATELLKRGFKPNKELFYYQTRNKREVDFVLKNGSKITELIQVCYDISNPETLKRETKALNEAAEELGAEKLTIINWDKKSTRLVPLKEWLNTP